MDDLATPETQQEAAKRGELAVEVTGGRTALLDVLRHGESYPISDAIADLLHMAEVNGHEAHRVIDDAINHYQCERS